MTLIVTAKVARRKHPLYSVIFVESKLLVPQWAKARLELQHLLTTSANAMLSILLVGILAIRIMIIPLTSRHSPSRCLQQPLTSIHDRRSIHLGPRHLIRELMRRSIKPRNMRVDIDTLPMALGNMIRLVKDGEMRMLLDSLVPPVPSFAMVIRVREFLQPFH